MRERRRRRGRCEARREKSAQKSAPKKKDVIERNREEYSLKKQENKILGREQPICFLQVESRHFGFQNKLKLKKLTTSSKELKASLLSGSYIQTSVAEHFLSNSHSVTHIGYLSQLKHLDMNAIVSGKHARRTSFGKPKPSSLWEWTNVTNYNHYVIFNFFLGLFFLAASPYHVIPCNFRLLFYRSIYSVYSCFFLINLIKADHSRNIVYLSLFHVGWSVFAVT